MAADERPIVSGVGRRDGGDDGAEDPLQNQQDAGEDQDDQR